MSGDYTAERDALILLCRKLEAERDELAEYAKQLEIRLGEVHALLATAVKQ